MNELGKESFVVFPLGGRRYALSSREVVELFRAGEVQAIPHTTPDVSGVLLRRGEILPVWDLAAAVGIQGALPKLWLVTRHNFAGEEPTAIAVSGECRLVRAEVSPPSRESARHVRGFLMIEDGSVEVLDLTQFGTPDPATGVAKLRRESGRGISDERK